MVFEMNDRNEAAALLRSLRSAVKAVESFTDRTHGPAVRPDAVELSDEQWTEAAILLAKLASTSVSSLMDAGIVEDEGEDVIDAATGFLAEQQDKGARV